MFLDIDERSQRRRAFRQHAQDRQLGKAGKDQVDSNPDGIPDAIPSFHHGETPYVGGPDPMDLVRKHMPASDACTDEVIMKPVKQAEDVIEPQYHNAKKKLAESVALYPGEETSPIAVVSSRQYITWTFSVLMQL